MKYIIDTDKLEKYGLDIDEALYLASLYFKSEINNDTFNKLNSKGLLFVNSFKDGKPADIDITIDGTQLIEALFVDSEVKETIKVENKEEDRYIILANKLRELYPAGRKPGTNLQWRDSSIFISARLKTLVKKYKVSFTDEEVIDATERYIKSFNGDYRYMQVLKYFIMKTGTEDGVNVCNSQLMSYIENKGQDNQNKDWTVEMR